MNVRTRDAEANRFYASARWRRLRRRQLRTHPYCQCDTDCCPKGCDQPANEVDHIDGNWRNSEEDNLQSLTPRCHARKTRRQTAAHRPKRRREPEQHPGLVTGGGGGPPRGPGP